MLDKVFIALVWTVAAGIAILMLPLAFIYGIWKGIVA